VLWDKILRRDVLWRAWVAVRRNDSAPGVDRTTLDQVEQYGITRLLEVGGDRRWEYGTVGRRDAGTGSREGSHTSRRVAAVLNTSAPRSGR
jgi:hypothetical protein